MIQILDGKALAETIRTKIKDRVTNMEQKPGLAIILVGDDPASHIYVQLKQKACEEAGIRFEKIVYAKNIQETVLLQKIQELNQQPEINGILVQLPLPSQDPDRVIAAILPEKDVDGFHAENLTLLKAGRPSIAPAVALGIMKLIDKALLETKRTGLHTAIISSEFFGAPLQILLQEQGITSEIISAEDSQLNEKTLRADILISALGRPHFIKGSMLKPGVILIDVGTTKVDGKLVGDIDQNSVKEIASALTPVPGGVGPMTVAMLLLNVLTASIKQKKSL